MKHRAVLAAIAAVVGACANGGAEEAASDGDAADAAAQPFSPYGDLDAAAGADARARDAATDSEDPFADEEGGADASAPWCAPVPGGQCGVVPQCGCPPSFTCDFPGGAGITQCVQAGTKAAYQPCTLGTQCAVGLTCIDGACKPFCTADGDCPSLGSACVQVRDEGFPVRGYLVCTSACDLANPGATCGPGLTCLTSPTSTDCAGPVGTGIGPGACPGGLWACAPGYTCGGASGHDCVKWCRLAGSDCDPGQTCTALAGGPVTVRGEGYGGCQ